MRSEKVTSATIKAAYERVLPENYARLLPMHMDPDNVDPAALEEKVTALIRQNSTGVADMDMRSSSAASTRCQISRCRERLMRSRTSGER